MNRLSAEKSPYFLMHSQNPVDWFPWSEEAFSRARREDKPVFLSIGYSSCHWCHVIAHESFEDEEIAARVNADYVAVKVDKEERPDVDAVYMDAVELATGSGGWPMTILTTPDGAPFFAATYLPRDSLDSLLRSASALWKDERAEVTRAADRLVESMRDMAERGAPPRAPDEALLTRAVSQYMQAFDETWGGFGRAPKFPAAHNLLFLLAHYGRTGEREALMMAEKTLTAMARGGIFDHIGGGFCRYSVDRKWLVPHFEKMLYDNALLLWAYAEAYRLTKNALYKTVAERTADYVLRELTGADGEFFCSQDADSEGREGAYYLFSRGELLSLLGENAGARYCDAFDITQSGNFEGASIPNLIGNTDWEKAFSAFGAERESVYAYRKDRLPLGRDDKVLTTWNALMIAALCEASHTLDRRDYLSAARRAEEFLSSRLYRGDAPLIRYRDGDARGDGVLSDYANLALARLALFEATGERAYLDGAERLANALRERFADRERGGFFLYSDKSERLVTRPKDVWDNAMPSGNSCAALVFCKLAEHTDNAAWRRAAKEQLAFVAGAAHEHPTGYGFALLAMTRALSML